MTVSVMNPPNLLTPNSVSATIQFGEITSKHMTVYRLNDLESRDHLDAGHSKPARLAVIGYPVAHSASPRMHQPALDEAGIDARYIALEVEPGQVAEAFQRMR